mgnify:CR=1 FL=1
MAANTPMIAPMTVNTGNLNHSNESKYLPKNVVITTAAAICIPMVEYFT